MRLELAYLTRRYGEKEALSRLSLSLPDFRTLAIIGPSGGGKTTLLRILAGLVIPDEGKVLINGDTFDFNEKSLLLHRRSIGTVFQAYNLFPHLSARKNIMLPLVQVHGMNERDASDLAVSLLQRFQLQDHGEKFPAELSGGQQQRVAIVRAIAIKPRFLLFDEPTSALDPEMTAEVLDLIAELKDEGRDLIIVTHNMGFARHVADQCLFIAEGRSIEWGSAAAIFDAPETDLLSNFLRKILRY